MGVHIELRGGPADGADFVAEDEQPIVTVLEVRTLLVPEQHETSLIHHDYRLKGYEADGRAVYVYEGSR